MKTKKVPKRTHNKSPRILDMERKARADGFAPMKELADAMPTSVAYAHRWMRDNDIPSRKIGQETWANVRDCVVRLAELAIEAIQRNERMAKLAESQDIKK